MRSILSRFPTEKIRLIKQDGQIFSDIIANVQPTTIFVEDETVPFEEDDIIEREIGNGLTEEYIILDRGYYKGIGGIPNHYQIKVEKTNKKKKESYITNNYYNSKIGKVNIDSNDYSTTTTIEIKGSSLFDNMLQKCSEIDNSNDIELEIVKMRENQGTPQFKDHYNSFIQSAANHMTLFAPFIPALTELLTGIRS